VANKEDIKKRILEENDYIRAYKFGNSLNKFLLKNTKELDDLTIARLLMIDKDEVEDIYQKAVDLLRASMVESKDES
jgi:hypothetical protein